MPLSDIAVLLVVAAGTILSAGLLRRQGIRGRDFGVAAWAAFYGFVLTAMMAAHSAEILYHLMVGGNSMRGTPWQYDFRTYSLFLLGAVVFREGARCLRAAPGLGRRDPAARAVALRATLTTLVIVAPLIPIHAFFGVLLTALSAVGLLVVFLSRVEASALDRLAAGTSEIHA